jgi:hypothetical protein
VLDELLRHDLVADRQVLMVEDLLEVAPNEFIVTWEVFSRVISDAASPWAEQVSIILMIWLELIWLC